MLKPIKWWPSSCQMRRRTADVSLACELLREGRLFDDYALEEQESAEEMTEELQSFVRIQKISRINRDIGKSSTFFRK
uniref:Uncharacterized protein n=1 Tax=Meloidogyne javanica TaxID=6303 RepID=A0A915LKT2_MELJA